MRATLALNGLNFWKLTSWVHSINHSLTTETFQKKKLSVWKFFRSLLCALWNFNKMGKLKSRAVYMQFTFCFKDHLEIQKQPLEVFCKKCPQACNFIIKRLQHRCFPVKYTKLLRRPILKNICKWLLLLNELSVPKALTFLEIQVLIQDVLKYHCFRLIEVLSFQFLNLCKICDDQYCIAFHTQA